MKGKPNTCVKMENNDFPKRSHPVITRAAIILANFLCELSRILYLKAGLPPQFIRK